MFWENGLQYLNPNQAEVSGGTIDGGGGHICPTFRISYTALYNPYTYLVMTNPKYGKFHNESVS